LGALDSIILLHLSIEMQICILRSSEVARLWNIKHLTEMLVQVLRGAAVEQELNLDDCRSSCRSCVNRRSIIIWFSPILGLHTQLGCFKFTRCSFFKIGCLEHLQASCQSSLVDLTTFPIFPCSSKISRRINKARLLCWGHPEVLAD
jgi:hypothetical protein